MMPIPPLEYYCKAGNHYPQKVIRVGLDLLEPLFGTPLSSHQEHANMCLRMVAGQLGAAVGTPLGSLTSQTDAMAVRALALQLWHPERGGGDGAVLQVHLTACTKHHHRLMQCIQCITMNLLIAVAVYMALNAMIG
jgi:hypothetical protein